MGRSFTGGTWSHVIHSNPKMDQNEDDWQSSAEIRSAETGREICHLSRCRNADAMVLVQSKALHDALDEARHALPDGSPERAVAEKVLADCHGGTAEEWCRRPTNLQWSAMMPENDARRFLKEVLRTAVGEDAAVRAAEILTRTFRD